MKIFALRILPMTLLLGACAAPPQKPAEPAPPIVTIMPVDTAAQDTLRSLMALQDRLYRVTAPLLVNNAELCRANARKLLGFSAKNKYSYSADLAETAQKAFGFDERLQVTNVLAGSGAARADVRRGDILIAVEGQALAQGENAERNAAVILAPLVQKRANLQLSILRAGMPATLDIPLTQSCAFSVELGNSDTVNAYADGRRIAVTRGMLSFVQSDEELAYVIAREMAHNILSHPAKQKLSATLGGIIDNLIRVHPDLSTMTGTAGVKPYSQEMDIEADRLSLYLATRAGYGIDGAARFWERLASAHPAGELNGYVAIHPSTSARLAALAKASAEIRSKQAGRRPLIP